MPCSSTTPISSEVTSSYASITSSSFDDKTVVAYSIFASSYLSSVFSGVSSSDCFTSSDCVSQTIVSALSVSTGAAYNKSGHYNNKQETKNTIVCNPRIQIIFFKDIIGLVTASFLPSYEVSREVSPVDCFRESP